MRISGSKEHIVKLANVCFDYVPFCTVEGDVRVTLDVCEPLPSLSEVADEVRFPF